MLKAQLRSKISALRSDWQGIEDIITSDFFGTLDYLPREPFLTNFIEWVAACNAGVDVRQPPRDGVDWDDAELLFWPMLAAEDESAQPDVVIATNRWVLVVEVKLDSGLGMDQPWREYCVGRELARNRGLLDDSVFYLLVARQRLDISETFPLRCGPDRRDFLRTVSQLPWHRAVALIERWLNDTTDLHPITPDQQRLLTDLLAALRRRRALIFSGFEFINQGKVDTPLVRLFCPNRFSGFLNDAGVGPVAAAKESQFLSAFVGFLDSTPLVGTVEETYFSGRHFNGFSSKTAEVSAPHDTFLVGAGITGFLEGVPRCAAEVTWEIDT